MRGIRAPLARSIVFLLTSISTRGCVPPLFTRSLAFKASDLHFHFQTPRKLAQQKIKLEQAQFRLASPLSLSVHTPNQLKQIR
ncbi:hypothetical protein TorRG33x02_317220 [Trema orientale]|uniref:Secreted protein n=1 Tax=Trema orientale TaxID=63057 RepID=A0A2P5BL11_TREOI|nr:hypothetical protein TorRG33x02_317220 [Trema orientale]